MSTPNVRCVVGVLVLIAVEGLSWPTGRLVAQDAQVEAPPAADAAASQPAGVVPPVPKKTVESQYERLADPSRVKSLRLTAEQQAKIAEVFSIRDKALAQAPEPDRPAVMADADKQVEGILTPEQRQHWATLRRDETLRLRFSFRFQPWADVLNWFAQQADLSLVLDAPPPGTFNYTDTREYTVPEAVDLLNGVLLTKGYTLLRRERMLMLIDLAGELPTDLVPRVTLDELGARGKFELVSMVFAIGDRNAEDVKTELQPLIGPHGKISTLPKTKQVLVVETAGKMRAIEAVIESIPLPAGPAATAAPAAPALAVFPLAGLDSKATIEILSALFPDVKIVHDPGADQLMAQAAPEKRAAIESVLVQLRSDGAADKKARLERYPIKQAGRDDLLATLRLIVPEAVLRLDAQTGDLVAWAGAKQQAVIRENIDKLGQHGLPTAQRQLEVYPLRKSDPSSALALLQKMLPEARLAVDTTSKSIVALAGSEDQQAIKATLEQLEAHGPEKPQLKLYELNVDQRRRVQSVLTALSADLPGARVIPDSATGKLSVWATAEQQLRIEEIVKQVTQEVPQAEQFEIATYRLRSVDPANALSVLQSLLPEVKFVSDTKSKQIVAWARPQDQERIKKTIAQVDADVSGDQKLELMSHPVGKASVDTLLSILRSVLPDVQSASDVKNGAIVAWARKRDHEVIRRAIEQAQPNTPEAERAVLSVYPVPDADPVQLASMLTTVFPNARFSGDRTSTKLVAWATPAEQESIKKTVAGMLKSIPPDRELTPVVYRPKRTDVATLLADLRTVVPEARLASDPKNGALVAWATAADHERIRATVAGLDEGDGEGAGRTVALYHARDTDPATLLTFLQSAVPEARLVSNVQAGGVIAWARPEQHQILRQAAEGLEKADASPSKRVAKVYRFHSSDANAAYTVLRSLIPTAYFAVDTRTGSLAVTALPAEHEQVAAMVEQMEGSGTEAGDLHLEVYSIKSSDPANVLSMLRELFAQRPEVRFSVDTKSGKLAAWALPTQHAIIRDVVGRVDQHDEDVDDRQVEIYALRDADPETVGRTLTAMFSSDRNVKIFTDQQGAFVTVFAEPRVQASVKAIIDQMQGHNEEVAVLPLEVIDPFVAQTSIQSLFGDRRNRDRKGVPRVNIDPDGGQLLVRATSEQIAQIRSMLAKMGERQLAPAAQQIAADRRMRVIPINERAFQAAFREIERLWPQLRDNPIRIVTPSAVARTVQDDRARRSAAQDAQPRPASSDLPSEQPEEPGAKSEQPSGEQAPAETPPADSAEQDGGGCQEAEIESPAVADKSVSEQKPANDQNPAAEEKPAPENTPAGEATNPTVIAEEAPKAPPAIVVAPSGDSITISSDDPEALEQFEQLLKSFVQRSSAGGREFAIFHLKQANAVNVAETVQNVLSGGAFGFRGFGGNTVVADQRLNAVIVQAGRNDMAAIEKLIETLDSADQPADGIGSRPKLIQVKNTSAQRIADILRDVYKTQLSAGGAKRQAPLPERVSPEMSALIQQMNAASTGPEMTLGVDYSSNSIVVSAPAPLMREIESLVQTLDEQSNAAKPTVRVMALKRINTKALGKALDNLIQDAARTRRSP